MLSDANFVAKLMAKFFRALEPQIANHFERNQRALGQPLQRGPMHIAAPLARAYVCNSKLPRVRFRLLIHSFLRTSFFSLRYLILYLVA